MTKFYFIRHGEQSITEINTKIYQNWGTNMITLSEEGINQIKNSSKDKRLKNAQIIVTSPFGRALHSSAILSKELGIDIAVETNLHEWIANKDYNYISDEETIENLKEFFKNGGDESKDAKFNFESVADIKRRVSGVLEKYKNYQEVIVVCHSLVMQCFLGLDDPKNGEIVEYILI